MTSDRLARLLERVGVPDGVSPGAWRGMQRAQALRDLARDVARVMDFVHQGPLDDVLEGVPKNTKPLYHFVPEHQPRQPFFARFGWIRTDWGDGHLDMTEQETGKLYHATWDTIVGVVREGEYTVLGFWEMES